MTNAQRDSLQFYLAASILALLAIALGLWKTLVEREGGDWLIQLILPAWLVISLAGLHSQAVRDRKAREMEAEEEEEEEEKENRSGMDRQES